MTEPLEVDTEHWSVTVTEAGDGLFVRFNRKDGLPVTSHPYSYNADHKRGTAKMVIDKDRHPDGTHKLPR